MIRSRFALISSPDILAEFFRLEERHITDLLRLFLLHAGAEQEVHVALVEYGRLAPLS